MGYNDLTLFGILLLSVLFGCTQIGSSRAQAFEPNYDEKKIVPYLLPDAFVTVAGEKVLGARLWQENRRPEILDLFRTHVYGHSPEPLEKMTFEVARTTPGALAGKAVRKEVTVYFNGDKDGPKMELLIYLPSEAKEPVPLFLGLNFGGNHSVHSDPTIPLATGWMLSSDKEKGYVDHRATEKSRGSAASRWPVEMILARGYGVATIYYGDIDPDFDDAFQNGIHPLFNASGEKRPQDDAWGSIAAWAWGLRRALDYMETDKDIDCRRVAVLGHSRLGKASLWAGAQDERFAMIISNDSGCGGAALSRRKIGETVQRINTVFPHWFCRNFHQYNNRENALPVDQHLLLALIAPRPLYVASADEDQWADPRGEFLSLKHASPVYELFGKKAISNAEMPAANQPLHHDVAYHIRAGKHDITNYDWQNYLDFADQNLHAKDKD